MQARSQGGQEVNVNVKVTEKGTSPQKRSGMTRIVKGSHSFGHDTRVYPQM